ncbi:hypothetical protein CVT25_002834 [Psilocybe cyanescens]|uniref:Uncharacterized protein n=1 Tax=Psilocybe cyanescens TaxID=93625 RepID=A0A409WLC9_PSICY|nr:hypothetical protein CVT25_002834 [Psilocybe cyanescens]
MDFTPTLAPACAFISAGRCTALHRPPSPFFLSFPPSSPSPPVAVWIPLRRLHFSHPPHHHHPHPLDKGWVQAHASLHSSTSKTSSGTSIPLSPPSIAEVRGFSKDRRFSALQAVLVYGGFVLFGLEFGIGFESCAAGLGESFDV